MNETEIRNIVEAALLAAGRPLALDKLVELFSSKGVEIERAVVRSALAALGAEYEGRGIEIKEVASGYRVQVRSKQRDWLNPLFEERAPRYTRALLETLALIAYRQPITRAEIEEVRGVAVSSNIVRTLMERGWVRVVGFRDVPGKPSMLGTTREFLDYFGLKKLDDLPPLSEIKDLYPESSPQSDFIDALEAREAVQIHAAGAEERSVIEEEPFAPSESLAGSGHEQERDREQTEARGNAEAEAQARARGLEPEPEPEPEEGHEPDPERLHLVTETEST